MLSLRKKVLFSLIPAIALLLLLACIELALQLFVPSLDSPLVRTVTDSGQTWYEVNRRYLEKYFPANVVMLPELKPSLFKANKDPNTIRVFCLGESSMFGTPYQMTATISGVFRKQLRHLFPGREVEVINFGASAINTNVIVNLAQRVVDYKPDLVLIYAGHNEFYGPDGVGASFLEKRLGFLTQLKYRLRELRLVRLFQSWLAARLRSDNLTAERNMMKEVSRGAHVRLDSEDAERIFRLFEDNLRAIISTLQKRNIPIIASDVSSNMLFPPFAYNWRGEFDSIPLQHERGNYGPLLQHLTSLLKADSANAFLEYWLGRTHLALGDFDNARSWLLRARDHDLLKFRAPRRINEIIRNVCARMDVPCVSADSAFCSSSPHGITDEALFWEHLHPRARGYYLIADLFLKQALDNPRWLGENAPGAFARRLPYQTDTLGICWLDMAYADLSMQNLARKWPFTSYPVRPVVLDSADTVLKQIALDVYTEKLTWVEGCYRTSTHFQRTGHARQAATTYQALTDEYPRNFYAHYLLGNLYKSTGDLSKAITQYESCIAINPQYPFARVDLGLIRINEGRFDEALDQLSAAERITAEGGPPALRASIFYGLSGAYANKGEYAKALHYVDESLKLAPTYRAAQSLRAQLLFHH